MIKKGLSKEVTSPQKQRLRGSQPRPDLGEEDPGRRDNKCKGPKADKTSINGLSFIVIVRGHWCASAVQKSLDFEVKGSGVQIQSRAA